MNYSRRFNRLYLLICALWTFLILVGWPIWLRSERLENARKMQTDFVTGLTELQDSAADREMREKLESAGAALARLTYESASLAVIYRAMLKDWQLLLFALVVPPVIIYVVLYMLVMCGRWVFRGFKKS